MRAQQTTPRQTGFFNRLYAKSRIGVFWRGLGIGGAGFGLLFVDPFIAALSMCALTLIFFKPAIAMVFLLPLAAILTSANPAIFGSIANPAFIQAPLMGTSLALLSYLVLRQNLRPGRLTYVFLGCIFVGGLLSVMTTTSTGQTLESLWKFTLPLAPLVFWFDNRHRSACAAKEAPYALSGLMATLIIVSFAVMTTGAGYELNLKDFQGAFWHPQTLGMMMAAAFPLFLYANRLPLWLRIIILASLLTLAWLSWTRTALVTIAIIAFFCSLMWVKGRVGIMVTKSADRITAVAQALALIALAIGSLIYASTLEPQQYNATSSTQDMMTEQGYSDARAFALSRAYQNFAEHPITGIGFGVPSDPRLLNREFEAQTIEAFKNGLGSEVLFDKGNSYLAVFEETGLLGAPIWLGLLIFCLVTISAVGVPASAAGLILTLSILAEATAFSMGGVGMVLWASLILSSGFTSSRRQHARRDRKRNSAANLQRQRIKRERQLQARGFTGSDAGVSRNDQYLTPLGIRSAVNG